MVNVGYHVAAVIFCSLFSIGLMLVHNKLVDPLYSIKEKEIEKSQSSKKPYSD